SDQQIGVDDADRAGIAVGEIDAADGQPDVVDDRGQRRSGKEAANCGLYVVAKNPHVLDTRADRRAQVQLDLRPLDRGEEVLTEKGREPEGERDHAEQANDKGPWPRQQAVQQLAIAFAHALESMHEAALKPDERIGAMRLLPSRLHAVD